MRADTHARTSARTNTPRYTSLLKYSFMLLACRVLVGEPGRSFLREDLAMVCYEHEHLVWALGVALPAIFLWVVGFPIAKVLALYTRRQRLENEHTHATYGFLYNGYKPGFYWWEFVVDTRKILMAAISVFIGDERIYVKTILVVLLCFVSFALQVLRFEIGHSSSRRDGVACAVAMRAFVERRAEQAGRAFAADTCSYLSAWCVPLRLDSPRRETLPVRRVAASLDEDVRWP